MSITHITLGPVSHLVLLGYSPIFRGIADYGHTNGIEVSVITSPDQRDSFYPNIDFVPVETMDDKRVEAILQKHNPSNTLGISFGARWIFTRRHIDGLFAGRLINAHGTRLPYDRGGGGFSWRIMRNDRIGNLLLHKIDEGVDTGPIIIEKNYVIPRQAQLPSEIFEDYTIRLKDFVLNFIDSISKKDKKFLLKPQNNNLSCYNPRLYSEIHSWIDWTLPAEEIVRFITAFDDPYSGATCAWPKGICKIKNVQLHGGELPAHPFQAGITFRKGPDYIICYTHCGKSIIIQDIRDEKGHDIMPQIKVGDRLFSPPDKLAEAVSTRVAYTATGKTLSS